MASTLEHDVENDPDLKNCFLKVKGYARTLLGGIHHICTNDFRTPTGAIVWTDHGADHSERLVGSLDKLVQLPAVRSATLTTSEKCALLCAAWLHDVGMFLRHPDFPDLTVQRRHHGRLARTMLEHMPDRPSALTKSLSNQIVEICELHQTRTGRINATSSRTTLLGNLLLMADALDITWFRTSQAKQGGPVLKMIRSTTGLSEASAIEWWVNDCIKEVEITVSESATLAVAFTVQKDQLRQWKKDATGYESTLSSDDELVLLGHINDALCRYLKDVHLGAIKLRGGAYKHMIKDISITLVINGTAYQEKDFNGTKALPYDKPKQLWAEQLSDYDFAVHVNDSLAAIKKAVKADAVYIFVFDGLSNTIRYLHNEVFQTLNNLNESDVDVLRKQRILQKSGVIGHVAFCGLVACVPKLGQDPRRCHEREDDSLHLHSVMFHPLIRDRHLWAVLMVNRKESGGVSDETFRTSDIAGFKEVIQAKEGPIITGLDRLSKPYAD